MKKGATHLGRPISFSLFSLHNIHYAKLYKSNKRGSFHRSLKEAGKLDSNIYFRPDKLHVLDLRYRLDMDP